MFQYELPLMIWLTLAYVSAVSTAGTGRLAVIRRRRRCRARLTPPMISPRLDRIGDSVDVKDEVLVV